MKLLVATLGWSDYLHQEELMIFAGKSQAGNNTCLSSLKLFTKFNHKFLNYLSFIE